MKEVENIISNLSEILLYKMGQDELTLDEMAKKCGISKRKLCQIVSKEKHGITLETFIKICKNIQINYYDIFDFKS